MIMKNRKELVIQWEALKPKLKSFIFYRLKDKDDTEDLLQEVFIKAYTRFDSLKDISKLSSWLFSITRNEINAYFNAKKKGLSVSDILIEESPPTSHLDICITPFIDALPKIYSDAIRLADMENVSQKELAQQLNISYSGAKSRVQRGRNKLKELITDCCAITHDVYGNIIDYVPKKGGYCAANY